MRTLEEEVEHALNYLRCYDVDVDSLTLQDIEHELANVGYPVTRILRAYEREYGQN